MLNSANQKILAVDNSKFNKISFTKITDLSDIDILVTDKEIQEQWKQTFQSMNVKVYDKIIAKINNLV